MKPIFVEYPCECSVCGKIYDGSEWNYCPRCRISELENALETAQDLLEDDAPLHALDVIGRVL